MFTCAIGLKLHEFVGGSLVCGLVPVALTASTLSLSSSVGSHQFRGCSYDFFENPSLTICRLATCAGAISANFRVHDDELHHVGLGDQLEDYDGCGRSGSTNCSARFVLNHSKYSCSEGPILFCRRFLSLTGIHGTCCGFHNSFFASQYPGLCHRGGSCFFSSTLRN